MFNALIHMYAICIYVRMFNALIHMYAKYVRNMECNIVTIADFGAGPAFSQVPRTKSSIASCGGDSPLQDTNYNTSDFYGMDASMRESKSLKMNKIWYIG